ncbi:hypothetical protein SAMN05444337_0891 [Flavobacterium haoranii]|uniref:Uncharacterized protein n=1 Tax=Flavobacterium haoranii TaxID=683124 RepID=A0A1M6EAG7_9FLAO|nr:hypothetical protein SAMN05444337_0891 [Flavobacterium haoranii]
MMKKFLSIGLMFVLFSAFTKETKTIKAQWWKVTCSDGSVHYFQCDCTEGVAWAIASFQCKPL